MAKLVVGLMLEMAEYVKLMEWLSYQVSKYSIRMRGADLGNYRMRQIMAGIHRIHVDQVQECSPSCEVDVRISRVYHSIYQHFNL